MVRELACDAIDRIFSGKEYSNIVINQIIRDNDLNEKDRALFTQIVLGVVKNKLLLDFYLAPFIKGKNLSSWLRHLLLLSIYQKVFLDKIPDYAIHNTAVEAIKKREYSATGLVNAVLRQFTLREDEAPEYIKYSVNEWLYKQIKGQYKDSYIEILESYGKNPKTSARVNKLKITREKLIDRRILPSEVSNVGLILQSGNWANTNAYRNGLVTVQDEASQLVARWLNPKRTDLVLDACAAPGGKTTHIAEIMKNQGTVIANDIHSHKLKLVEQNVDRLGLTNVEYSNHDATKLRKVHSREEFDKILVDAPCTGWGVIGRKPEIKYFASQEKTEEIIKIQKTILENTAPLLKVNGTMVYSTCTINKGENEVQIKRFLKENPNFELERETMILPHTNHTDGFYIAKLKKVSR